MVQRRKAVTIAAAIDRFLLALLTSGRSEKTTVPDYRRKLELFSLLLETRCVDDDGSTGVTLLKQVTTDHIRQFIYILQTENVGSFKGRRHVPGRLADSSVQSYVLVVKSFFSWCYREGLIVSNPADDRLPLPKVAKKKRQTFTTETIQLMLDACDRSTDLGYRDYAILLVLFDTGARLSEIAHLRIEDIHEGRESYIKVMGKGRREREIGMHTATSMVLWKYIEAHRDPRADDEPRLFIGQGGKPLGSKGIQQLIRRIQKKAGINDIRVHAHLFRHTFSKFYMENGGDLFNLSRELGHSDIQTTKIYLEDFTSEQARKVHTKFSPVSLVKVNEPRRKRRK